MGQKIDMVDSIHRIADLLDRYPVLIDYGPNVTVGAWSANVSIWFYDQESKAAAAQIAEWIKILRRDHECLPGPTNKRFTDYEMTATVKMAGYTVQLSASREAVCTRVETGETEEYETPDPSVIVPMVKKTRPVVRWECSPLLADDSKGE